MKISPIELQVRLNTFPKSVLPKFLKISVGAATDKVPDKFICPVCKHIAFKCSKGCGLCFTYSCEHCIENSLKDKNQCPNPRCKQENPHTEYVSQAKIHPADLKDYSKINIKCSECNNIFNIEQAESHFAECMRPKFACSCGDPKIFREINDFMKHLQTECGD